jgi:hypothetical protein
MKGMAFYMYLVWAEYFWGIMWKCTINGMVFSHCFWFACDKNFEFLFCIDENVVSFHLLTWVFVWPGTWMESTADLFGCVTKHGELLCHMKKETSGVGKKGCKLFVAFCICRIAQFSNLHLQKILLHRSIWILQPHIELSILCCTTET